MIKTCFLVFAFLVFNLPRVSAQDPGTYLREANNDVRVASGFMARADDLLKGSLTHEKLELAMDLYIQAGQLFEDAANTYQQLLPNYARPEDLENSRQALQHCLDSIQEIKKRL